MLMTYLNFQTALQRAKEEGLNDIIFILNHCEQFFCAHSCLFILFESLSILILAHNLLIVP